MRFTERPVTVGTIQVFSINPRRYALNVFSKSGSVLQNRATFLGFRYKRRKSSMPSRYDLEEFSKSGSVLQNRATILGFRYKCRKSSKPTPVVEAIVIRNDNVLQVAKRTEPSFETKPEF